MHHVKLMPHTCSVKFKLSCTMAIYGYDFVTNSIPGNISMMISEDETQTVKDFMILQGFVLGINHSMLVWRHSKAWGLSIVYRTAGLFPQVQIFLHGEPLTLAEIFPIYDPNIPKTQVSNTSQGLCVHKQTRCLYVNWHNYSQSVSSSCAKRISCLHGMDLANVHGTVAEKSVNPLQVQQQHIHLSQTYSDKACWSCLCPKSRNQQILSRGIKINQLLYSVTKAIIAS